MRKSIHRAGIVLTLAGALLTSCEKHESMEVINGLDKGEASAKSIENISVPYVDMIASPESSLTVDQKISLGNAIGIYMNVCPENREVYFFLKDSGVKIRFYMDKNSTRPVEYLSNGYGMRFRATEDLTFGNLYEELLHAVQDIDLYKNQFSSFSQDIYFEAKVFRDLVAAKYATGESYQGSAGQNETFKQEYKAWIEGVASGSQSVSEKFYYFSRQCSSSANPAFTPQFIHKYFGENPVS